MAFEVHNYIPKTFFVERITKSKENENGNDGIRFVSDQQKITIAKYNKKHME